MSCRGEIAKIDIQDQEFGRVSGRVSRMCGSSGQLRAIPDEGYQFVEWRDQDGGVYSTNNPLIINKWDNITLSAMFEPIRLELSDFQSQDAMDTLVWNLEVRGLAKISIHGASHTISKSYSAGNYTSSSGTRTRVSDGASITLIPQRYGWNYNTTGYSGTDQIGKATYDPVNNTTVGHFFRSPTGEQRDYVTVPELIHGNRDQNWPISTTQPGSGGGTSGYTNGYFGLYNSNQLQFPLMQYAHVRTFYVNNHSSHRDWTDLTGLDQLDVYNFNPYYSGHRGNCGFRDIDAIHGWSNLTRIYNTYSFSYWTRTSSTWKTGSTVCPRPLEGLSYCRNLSTIQHITRQTWDPDSYQDLDQNPGWVTQYSNTPRSGDIMRVQRYNPVSTLYLGKNTNVHDYTLLDTTYNNLRNYHEYTSRNIGDHVIIDDFTQLKNKQHLANFNAFNAPKLNLTDMSFLSNKKMTLFQLYNTNQGVRGHALKFDNVINTTFDFFYINDSYYITPHFNMDPLSGETVALHNIFTNLTSLPDQDESRYQTNMTYTPGDVTITTIH